MYYKKKIEIIKRLLDKKYISLLFGNTFAQIFIGLTFLYISKQVDSPEIVDFGRNMSLANVISAFSTLRYELSALGSGNKAAKENFSKALISCFILSLFLAISALILNFFIDEINLLSLESLCLLIFSNSIIDILNKYYLIKSEYFRINLLKIVPSLFFIIYSLILLNYDIKIITLYLTLSKLTCIFITLSIRDISYFYSGIKIIIKNDNTIIKKPDIFRLFKNNSRNNFSAINKKLAFNLPMIIGPYFISSDTLSCYYILATSLNSISASLRRSGKEMISKKFGIINKKVDINLKKFSSLFIYFFFILVISLTPFYMPELISLIIKCREISFLTFFCILNKGFYLISDPFSDLIEIWGENKKLFNINVRLFFMVFIVWPTIGIYLNLQESYLLIIYLGMMSFNEFEIIKTTYDLYKSKIHINNI